MAVSVRIFGWQLQWGYLGGTFSEEKWVAVLVRIFEDIWLAVLVRIFG